MLLKVSSSVILELKIVAAYVKKSCILCFLLLKSLQVNHQLSKSVILYLVIDLNQPYVSFKLIYIGHSSVTSTQWLGDKVIKICEQIWSFLQANILYFVLHIRDL